MESVVSSGGAIPSLFCEDLLPVLSPDADLDLPEGSDCRLADLLRVAAPSRAYAFALAMHERACEGHDDAWCELWQSALEALRPYREASNG